MFSINTASKSLLILSLSIGVITHSVDFVVNDFAPYQFAPTYIRLYWCSLLFIDLGLILVVIFKTNLGLALCAMLMTSNVIINFLAYKVESIIISPIPLLFQTLFLGIVMGIALNGYKKR